MSAGAGEPNEALRAWLIAATAEVVAQGDYPRQGGHLRLAKTVIARTFVPARKFYEIFQSEEDCFVAAFEEGVDRLSRAVLKAARREKG